MDAIVLFDPKHRVVDINQRFSQLFGYTLAEIKGMDMDDVMNSLKDGSADKSLTQNVLSGKQVAHESTRFDKSGQPIDVLIKGIPVIINGEFVGGYGIYCDISERKRYEAKLQYLSMHDARTGLYNRVFFEEEMNRLASGRDYPITIISADLDGLKLINDTLGHGCGDELIKACAEALRLSLRKSDILARVGGDEFAILLPLANKKIGEEIVGRVRAHAAWHNKRKPQLPLSISMGVATADNSCIPLEEIYKRADDNMYHDKLVRKKQRS